jgi:hypothetical protein
MKKQITIAGKIIRRSDAFSCAAFAGENEAEGSAMGEVYAVASQMKPLFAISRSVLGGQSRESSSTIWFADYCGNGIL